jgi:hypothetical protein
MELNSIFRERFLQLCRRGRATKFRNEKEPVRILKKHRLAAAMAATVAALLPFAGPVGSASAASLPVLDASEFQMAHKCTVIGSADGYQGVVCADIVTGVVNPPYPTGYYWALGQVELICQTTAGVTVQCANAKAEVNLYGEGWNVGTTTWQCGHSYGPCSTGRNYWTTDENGAVYGPGWTYSNCTSSIDNVTQVWSVVFGGGATTIELPVSDKTVSLTGNLSPGHYFACP